MGWVSLERRAIPAARTAFTEALRLDPGSLDARTGMVSVLIAEGDYETARARVEDWTEAAPGDVDLKMLSARVATVGRRPADAERMLRDVIAADPSRLEAYDLLGRLYVAQGQLDRALAEFRKMSGQRPGAAGPATMIGMILEAQGKRDEAQAQYEQVLAGSPRSGVAANNLAWMYAEGGRYDEAVRLASVAAEVLRDRPEPQDTLGWAYYRQGLAVHALPAFERAIERAPDNPVYHYHLGLAHLKAGNEERGRAALRRALDIRSDFPGADDARRALAEARATGQDASRN
jgi:tetratricopeptide (TPR) repeat protein